MLHTQAEHGSALNAECFIRSAAVREAVRSQEPRLISALEHQEPEKSVSQQHAIPKTYTISAPLHCAVNRQRHSRPTKCSLASSFRSSGIGKDSAGDRQLTPAPP